MTLTLAKFLALQVLANACNQYQLELIFLIMQEGTDLTRIVFLLLDQLFQALLVYQNSCMFFSSSFKIGLHEEQHQHSGFV